MLNNGRIEKHEEIILKMHDTYIKKNSDYGNSFTRVRDKYPLSILVRLSDKFNRLEQLLINENQQVMDESIDDTLLDMANYCVLELIERKTDNEKKIQEVIHEALKGCGTNVIQFPTR